MLSLYAPLLILGAIYIILVVTYLLVMRYRDKKVDEKREREYRDTYG